MSSCLSVIASRVGNLEMPKIAIARSPIAIRCGLVCTVNDDSYLRIPTDNIWLIPDNGFSQDVVVYSNVSWVIE